MLTSGPCIARADEAGAHHATSWAAKHHGRNLMRSRPDLCRKRWVVTLYASQSVSPRTVPLWHPESNCGIHRKSVSGTAIFNVQ